MADTGGPTTRRGRRPGTNTTRSDVLEAARSQFATHGFGGTTIRGVAHEAGVDPSLVMQFFRSKNDLFAAVVAVPQSVLSRLDDAFDGPAAGHGERLVRAFLDVWEGEPEDSEPLMAVLRSAVLNDAAREQLRGFIEARLVEGMARRAGEPGDAALRAGAVAAMLVGVVLARRVIAVPTLAGADREELVQVLAPAVQAVVG